jgi:hypothetical protein
MEDYAEEMLQMCYPYVMIIALQSASPVQGMRRPSNSMQRKLDFTAISPLHQSLCYCDIVQTLSTLPKTDKQADACASMHVPACMRMHACDTCAGMCMV